MIVEIAQFFDFQDGCHPPYWILKSSNSVTVSRMERHILFRMPNFAKIGPTVADYGDIWIFFKMAAEYLARGAGMPRGLNKCCMFDLFRYNAN